jgi:uncharacterized membrane protein YhaH (DUF805 family)
MEGFMGFINQLADKLPAFLQPWGDEYLRRYFDIDGRTDRKTYWVNYLYTFIITAVLSIIPVLGWLVSLLLVVPGVTITIRRLNDIGKTWPWIFISFVPCVGPIILIVFMVMDSAA